MSDDASWQNDVASPQRSGVSSPPKEEQVLEYDPETDTFYEP